MKILTWNIQATKGVDTRYDLKRIVDRINLAGDLDVICLQEVSRNIPDLNADDQLALFTNSYPNHTAVWGPGFSAFNEGNQAPEFGNLTLVRSALLQDSRVHCLPSPRVPELQMPRTMVEIIIAVAGQQFALFNTHLAFHSSVEQIEQIEALTYLRDQVLSKSGVATAADAWGPYKYSRPCEDAILCGDLNIDSDSDVYREFIVNKGWVDCWDAWIANDSSADLDRQPTCGCFDHVQWPQGPHVRDYFLATGKIAARTKRLFVDTETDASDHQPVLLEINL